jgi:4TM region of DNA translocase FtsK/SpoIIIE
VSGFSPVTLSFLGLVFVVALCVSILAVRRDHTDNAHTLWYVFSLTLCSVSVLFFYTYEKSRAIQSTPLGGMAGRIPVTFMRASMDVREGIYILLTAGALLILPQILGSHSRNISVADSPSRQ